MRNFSPSIHREAEWFHERSKDSTKLKYQVSSLKEKINILRMKYCWKLYRNSQAFDRNRTIWTESAIIKQKNAYARAAMNQFLQETFSSYKSNLHGHAFTADELKSENQLNDYIHTTIDWPLILVSMKLFHSFVYILDEMIEPGEFWLMDSFFWQHNKLSTLVCEISFTIMCIQWSMNS